MDTLKGFRELLLSDEKFSEKTVSIQNYSSFYEYYLSLGIPSNVLLKDSSFKIGNFNNEEGWVSFRDSVLMQLNAIKYSGNLTSENWVSIGEQLSEGRLTRIHRILMSLLTIEEIFKKITTISSYYTNHSTAHIESISSNSALISMDLHPLFSKYTIGGLSYFAVGAYGAIPSYKRKKIREAKMIFNFAPLENLITFMFSPFDLEYRETEENIFINNKKIGRKIILKEYLKDNYELPESIWDKLKPDAGAVLVTNDLIVNDKRLLKGGEVFNAPFSLFRIQWCNRKNPLSLIGDLIRQQKDRIRVAAEYEEQLSLANQRYFEVKKQNKMIQEISDTLKKERDNLDLRVKEKTKSIESTNSELKRVYENQTRFFITLTHELKTPLSILLSNTDAVIDGHNGLKNESSDSLYENNKKQLLRMKTILNRLMVYAKIQMNDVQLDHKVHHLKSIMAQLKEEFKEQADSMGINLCINFSDFEEKYISGDILLLFILFRNLIDNAIKFNRPGGYVSVKYENREGKHVIKISDSGIGISNTQLPIIFDRFYQVDNKDNRQYEGAGIGLALAKEIITLHGGSISVESEDQKGTTFSVFLDQAAVLDNRTPDPVFPADQNAESFQRPEYEELPAGSQGKASILIVEDNTDLLETLKLYLSSTFTVKTATDGKIALERLSSFSPDIIVTDIMMPVMDGITLIKELKENERFSKIPIIVLSAKDGEQEVLSAYDFGIIDYINKPFSIGLLNKKLLNIIKWLNSGSPHENSDKETYNRLKSDYGISIREFEVIHYLQKGESNKGISIILDLSPKTIKRHIENIYKKLDIHDRYQLFYLISLIENSPKDLSGNDNQLSNIFEST